MIYTFTQEDTEKAWKEWFCNCGPAALAFALQTTLDAVHPHIPKYDERHYTSPTMMRAALKSLGRTVQSVESSLYVSDMFRTEPALCRLQWSGPWIINGKPQKWAARHTHWICCWNDEQDLVFDINGGIRTFDSWYKEIVPLLVKDTPRCDGKWWPVNIWRLIP